MKINWGVVGTVAAIAFQTIALTGTVVSAQQSTQTSVTELRVDIGYLKRDVQRLTDKIFP